MVLGRGKWTKHKILRKSTLLRLALPNTRIFNKRNFLSYIEKYNEVIVKPSDGSGGAGVMQVISAGYGLYAVQYGKVKITLEGLPQTYQYIRSKTKRNYLVQQRIPLAKVKGKPFDVRVMVQKKRGSSWVLTGTMAKIAGSVIL